MMIKNLPIRLPEFGKIKIGRKGRPIESKSGTKYSPPEKLDHFIVTTMERDEDDNFQRDESIHALPNIGAEPKSIPVRLVYNSVEANFPNRWACYQGKTAWCTGDGETAQRLGDDGKRFEVECTCERASPDYEPAKDRCKASGALSVMIDGAGEVGGVHTFRTTSYNSVVGLVSCMVFIKETVGRLAGIPLNMKVFPKKVEVKGKALTVYIVGLFFSGSTDDMGRHALEAADIATPKELPEHVAPEGQALPGDDERDIAPEFYPQTGEVIEPELEPLEDRMALAESLGELIKLGEEAKALPEGGQKDLCRTLYQKAKSHLTGPNRARSLAETPPTIKTAPPEAAHEAQSSGHDPEVGPSENVSPDPPYGSQEEIPI